MTSRYLAEYLSSDVVPSTANLSLSTLGPGTFQQICVGFASKQRDENMENALLRAALLRNQRQLRRLPQQATPCQQQQGANNWVETLDSLIADGTQISNSTSETIMCPDFSIPAYYMVPGRTLRIMAFGVMSNVVTTPGTLTVRIRWGGVAGTLLLASAAQGLDTTARTNSMWMLEAWIACRAAGATGSFMSGGVFMGNVLSSTAANLLPALLGSAGAPLASANAAVTVDTTTAKLLSLTAQFSVNTNPTNLTCQGRVIKVIN